ncbi:MAG: peptidoglycan editing factor PgeF [Bacillota bacterium]|jgi:YfiH family protein|nr:peptidoglycan editing factor PgeF [Bacillota bacterium]
MEFVLKEEPGKVPYLLIPGFGGKAHVRAIFSTRHGGVSKGPFSSLNLGFHTGDFPTRVAANRRILYKTLGLTDDQIHTTEQVHGDRVLVIKERQDLAAHVLVQADAQVTALRGVALTGFFADCLAVYLYDPVGKVIGLAHAGWRGTVGGIARKCVEAMKQHFGSEPGRCFAALSPAAGPCCYEVGKMVADAVKEVFPEDWGLLLPAGEGKWKLDLWRANFEVLHEMGIKRENIIVSTCCTICRQDLFFSHRGSEGITGRMAALLILD